MTYITAGFETDPDTLLASMIADYQARGPGWAANPSDPIYVLLATAAYRNAVLLDVCSQVTDAIFRYEGRSILGVPSFDPTAATATATFTMTSPGATVTVGHQVDIYVDAINTQRFTAAQTVTDTTGSTSLTVPFIAQDTGAQGNGLTGPVLDVDGDPTIASITLVAPTAGGSDGEDDPTYMDRLVLENRGLTRRIVTVDDLERALLDVQGVGRVLVLDNYIPASTRVQARTTGSPAPTGSAQTGVGGAATAVITDASGVTITDSDLLAAALAAVDQQRLDDVAIYLMGPTQTAVSVTWSAVTVPGAVASQVQADGNAAIAAYLNPASWGGITDGGWTDLQVVRFGEIYSVLNAVLGLDYVTSVAIGGGSPNTDYAIPGPAAVATTGTITGTVTSP